MPETIMIVKPPVSFDETICRLFLWDQHPVVDVCSSAGWMTPLAANKGRRVFVACHHNKLQDLTEQFKEFPNVSFHSHTKPMEFSVDELISQSGLRHLPFVRIENEDDLAGTLAGASNLLRHSRIDCLLFDLTKPDELKLEAIRQHLVANNYQLCVIDDEKIVRMPVEHIAGRHPSGSLFALHERLFPWFFREDPKILEYFQLPTLCGNQGVEVTGVIHVGAHEGQELSNYHRLRTKRVFFIEANPEVFVRLKEKIGHVPGVRLLNRAILDRDGEITLNVTSFDQSSSIFELGAHLDIYPDISETHKVLVRCSTLDNAMQEESLDASAYNLLVLDVQGAELATLKGATKTLETIRGILVEVCFDNLFKNAPQIDEVDDFLNEFGFRRIATESYCHPSWGNAFYARTN